MVIALETVKSPPLSPAIYSYQLADDWTAAPQLDQDMARRHAALIAGKGQPVYIRFLHDAKAPGAYAMECKGTIDELWSKIVEAQAQGYGVFLVVNEGDADPGHQVSNRNVTRVRALFIDRDKPAKPGAQFHVRPSFVNTRNADKQHSYWLLSDCPVLEFRTAQRRLALHYETDPAICNPARIMRLGGTWNLKDPAHPEMYKLKEAGNKHYLLAEIMAGLPELPAPKPSNSSAASGKPLHPETVEKMFAHWDPTLEDNRGRWVGAIRLLAEHGIPLTREVPTEWWRDVASEWSKGTLRRKHIDPNFPEPETYKGDFTEDQINRMFAEPDCDRAQGDKFQCGSLIEYARAGGYRGSIDDTPAAEVFARALENIKAKAVAEANNKPEALKHVLETGSDIELARCILADLQHQHGDIVYTEGAFYFYDGKRWAEVPDNMLRRACHHYDGRGFGEKGTVKLSQSRINSILHEMGVMCAQPDFFSAAATGVNCANGFIEFDKGGKPSLVPHDPNQRVRHIIPTKWQADTDWTWEAPLLNTLLDGCFQNDADKAERIALLGEVCGAAALGYATKLKQAKALILHGPQANNGKSEIIKVIGGVLPSDATVAVSPSKFDLDPMFVRLRGKLLNAVAELGTSRAISSDAFKATITGDERTARDVYKAAEEVRPIAQHVMATNNLPPFQGGFDNGVKRRLIVLPLTRVIPADEMVPYIGDRIIAEETEALLAFVVDGASRLIRRGAFTVPSSSREALTKWVNGADPVRAWAAECVEYVEGYRTLQSDARDAFAAWARREGFDQTRFPGPAQFAQRILGCDHRFDHVQNRGGRYFVGLRISPLTGWAPERETWEAA
jgi:putative DNA primase/helicase